MMSQKGRNYSIGILTVSDSRSCGGKADISGQQMADLVSNNEFFPSCHLRVHRKTVPDNKKEIMDVLISWADVQMLDLILTVGGTGFSPRDVTPEATEAVCERKAASLAHAMTTLCYQDSPYALLSRATCGIRKRTVILNLPGSPKGSRECFLKIAKILPHAVDQVRGDLEAVEMTHTCTEGTSVPAHKASAADIPKIALRPRTSPYPMISSDEALQIILSHSTTLGVELMMKAQDYVGRISAFDVRAIVPSPPFRASIKDGYAVFASDGTQPRKLLGAVVAGDSPEAAVLRPGGCVRVNTGGPVPVAADAVVQVEDTAVSKKSDEGDQEIEILILKDPVTSLDIREIGSDIEGDQVIIPRGKVITTFDCGILASSGIDSVVVYRFPRVALLSTGNELVRSKGDLKIGTIIDSSKPVLSMMLREMDIEYFDMGIAKDDPDDIKCCLEQSFVNCDVVIVTGGVSMGEKDFVKDVLIGDFNADIQFGRIHMKPGKPTVFATVMYNEKKKLVFCLPGNPVSTVVTFHVYVVPCLRKIMGHKNVSQLRIKATLAEDLKLDPRPEYHRTVLTWDKEGRAIAHSTGSQLSSRLLSLSSADGLMVLPPRTKDVPKLNEGSTVEVMLLNYFALQNVHHVNL